MISKPNYRNKFEQGIGEALGPKWEYEPFKIDYTVYRTYTPDFVLTISDCFNLYVEAKGYFRPGDRQKYKAIRDSLTESGCAELVFYLQYPNKKVQKGATLTMSGWCDKESIQWVTTVEDLEALGVKYGHI
jgi:hypothetical protein